MLLVFGPGYTASRVMDLARAMGFAIETVGRATLAEAGPLIAPATHILSSVPPDGDVDPVLATHGPTIAAAPARWIGYLSSTGVYGNTGGAWVDESAPISGRRGARNAADAAWTGLHPAVRLFRLPGIYGPGRSALDRLREGKAHRVDVPRQVFSRIHVDDIAAAVCASFAEGPPGVYNIADDLPAPQNDVIAAAAHMLGLPVPPLLSIEAAGLSPMARAFYAENRRIANGKAKRLLGWNPLYPTYREGLSALVRRERSATAIPVRASSTPSPAGTDQR